MRVTFTYGETEITARTTYRGMEFITHMGRVEFENHGSDKRAQPPGIRSETLETPDYRVRVARERIPYVNDTPRGVLSRSEYLGHNYMFVALIGKISAQGMRLLIKENGQDGDFSYIQDNQIGPEILYIKQGQIKQAKMFYSARDANFPAIKEFQDRDVLLSAYTHTGRWVNSEFEYMARENPESVMYP